MRSALFICLLGLAACSGSETPTTEPAAEVVDERVAKAARVARAVDANPSGGSAALQAEGLTEAELEDLLYTIAEDPELSAAYAKARGK